MCVSKAQLHFGRVVSAIRLFSLSQTWCIHKSYRGGGCHLGVSPGKLFVERPFTNPGKKQKVRWACCHNKSWRLCCSDVCNTTNKGLLGWVFFKLIIISFLNDKLWNNSQMRSQLNWKKKLKSVAQNSKQRILKKLKKEEIAKLLKELQLPCLSLCWLKKYNRFSICGRLFNFNLWAADLTSCDVGGYYHFQFHSVSIASCAKHLIVLHRGLSSTRNWYHLRLFRAI